MTNAEAWFNIALRPRKPEGSLGRTAQDDHLDPHTAPELWPFITPWEDPGQLTEYTPPPPPPMLVCSFICLIKRVFLSSWRLFFQKAAKILNFWKVAINFCDSVNPLWVYSRFSRSKRWQWRCCGVAAIVLSQWQCSFFDRLCCINGYT